MTKSSKIQKVIGRVSSKSDYKHIISVWISQSTSFYVQLFANQQN